MRRVATAALALSILLMASAASASTTYTIQIHNQSSNPVVVIVFQQERPNLYRGAEKIREHVAPGDYFVSDDVKPNSCVQVRVSDDEGDSDSRCKDNSTPVALRCDVSDQYSCKVHAGEVKDLVVNVTHPR